jgi:large subunit ribosomal protein L24
MHIRVDDTVEVITGDDSGKRAKVLRVDRKAGKIVVEGVNTVHKHVRRSQKNPQGGRLRKEMGIQFSNVMLVCPACNAATRTGARREPGGDKVRYCKKCGAAVGQLSGSAAKKQEGAKS